MLLRAILNVVVQKTGATEFKGFYSDEMSKPILRISDLFCFWLLLFKLLDRLFYDVFDFHTRLFDLKVILKFNKFK